MRTSVISLAALTLAFGFEPAQALAPGGSGNSAAGPSSPSKTDSKTKSSDRPRSPVAAAPAPDAGDSDRPAPEAKPAVPAQQAAPGAGENDQSGQGGQPRSGQPASQNGVGERVVPPGMPPSRGEPIVPGGPVTRTPSQPRQSAAKSVQTPPPNLPTPGGGSARPGRAGASQDCYGSWDPGTHMSKAQWDETCRRLHPEDRKFGR
jgi:hypothetical protein